MSQSLSRALTILGELGEGSKSLEQLATRLDVPPPAKPLASPLMSRAKILVADRPRSECRRIAERLDYVKFTERSSDSPEAYLEELELVAAQGFAEDHEEHESFMNCIDVPAAAPALWWPRCRCPCPTCSSITNRYWTPSAGARGGRRDFRRARLGSIRLDINRRKDQQMKKGST